MKKRDRLVDIIEMTDHDNYAYRWVGFEAAADQILEEFYVIPKRPSTL